MKTDPASVDTTGMAETLNAELFAHAHAVRVPRWRRFANAAGAWVLIIIVARLVVPSSTRAASDGAPPATPLRLGTIVCPEYRVDVFAGSPGPTYTVRDAQGRVLADRLSADMLAERFPHLNPAGLTAMPTADTFSHAGADD